MLGFTFDLREQLVFYGSYHNNFWNQIVHVIFVPLIFWTVAVWLAYTPSLLDPSAGPGSPGWLAFLLGNLRFTGAAFEVIGYGLYYLSLEPAIASIWIAFVGLPTWVTATWFRAAVPCAWAWAVGLHVLSWIVQISLGHQRFERRKPALLDSFFQSLVLAPLFVTYEVAFWLGYRPAFRRELEQAIRENIRAIDGGDREEAKEPLVQAQ